MARTAVTIPFYATAFRKEELGAALEQIGAISLRYGAHGWQLLQSHDDLYKFLLILEFDDKAQWEAFWYGEDFSDMRAACSGWYQVPLLYNWNDVFGSRGPVAVNGSPA